MRELGVAVINGLVIVLALATMFAAGELVFHPQTEDVNQTAATFAVASSLFLLFFQYLYFTRRGRAERAILRAEEAEGEFDAMRERLEKYERSRSTMRGEIEALSAHREISRAASLHTSFDDFMDEVGGVVRDLGGVREFSVFLTDAEGGVPMPRAYYRLDRPAELYLSFTTHGGEALMEHMDSRSGSRNGIADSELFSAERLNITPRGSQVVITSGLKLGETEIGSIKLLLEHISPDNLPSPEMAEALMAGELGRVRFDNRLLREVMAHRKPVNYDAKAKLVEMAAPLVLENENIGAVKVRFDCHSGIEEDKMSARSQLLSESAIHIARAVRSERIYEQAIKDGLTGLFNKRHMVAQLEGFFNVARRHNSQLSMILVDIDHFKKVNDTYGHLTGDIILKGVSAVMREGVRSSDMAFRYGGEELSVVMPEGDLKGAYELAERLRQTIESQTYTSENNEDVKVTASMGVAKYEPGMSRMEDLVAHADAALYKAKETGRNRVIVWEEEG